MSWRGIVAGVLGLSVLQFLVANPGAYGAVGGVATGAAKAVQWFMDPNTPAIPDHSKAKTTSASSATSTTSTTYLPGLVSGVQVI